MSWKVSFINSKSEEEFLSLPAELKAKFIHIVNLIQEFGPFEIGLPHIKPIGHKLWEIRLKGINVIGRSIYVLSKDKKIIVLHSFIKKTQKLPQQALITAQKRMKEII